MIKKIFNFFLIISLIITVSCNNYKKVLKGNDTQKKYELAESLYNKKDYSKALQILDELVNVYRGTENAEKIYFMYAFSYYGQDDYILAGYHFKQFYKIFPSSKHAEEALYMNAYCKYLDSPVYTLDQTSTYEALEELQLFINTFPESTRVGDANKLMDELREKLEKKAYGVAFLYYKTEDFKAAIIALKNVLKDFPETKRKEEISYYIAKASYIYAQKSVDSKKPERYRSTVDVCNSFLRTFSGSRYVKEVTAILNTSNKKILN